MKFVKYIPEERLKPYIKYFIISENELESKYKVFPSSGLVIGLQYKGQLSSISGNIESKLNSAGITGITNGLKIFKNSAHIGTVLIYFTETGFAHFASLPANELFNLSLSLEDIFDKITVREIGEKLMMAATDEHRIRIVEQFLISQLKDIKTDKLVAEAINLIYQSNGSLRIKALNEKLFISQSALEKRFRKTVGTTAKKFASIVRFNTVLDYLDNNKSLSEHCYENNFFDQSHFIKDFKQYTGDTPQNFKQSL